MCLSAASLAWDAWVTLSLSSSICLLYSSLAWVDLICCWAMTSLFCSCKKAEIASVNRRLEACWSSWGWSSWWGCCWISACTLLWTCWSCCLTWAARWSLIGIARACWAMSWSAMSWSKGVGMCRLLMACRGCGFWESGSEFGYKYKNYKKKIKRKKRN